MGKSAQQYFSNKEDSQAKSAYLRAQYAEVKPLAFYDAVLGAADTDFPLCVAHTESAEGHRLANYENVLEMLVASGGRSDSFVYPAKYYNAYPKQTLMHELRCLYIDLDKVDAKSLRRLCQKGFYGQRPTYLVNSGNGVHLVYVLTQPLAAYHWAKDLLREMHSSLLRFFRKHRFAADLGTGLSHAYRIVGSLTKLGQTCRAYRVGKCVEVGQLAASLGICWQRPVSKSGKVSYNHKEKQPRKGSPARRGFYDYLVHTIEARTQEGHRYSSLFALACVGHKCHRAVEGILEDAVRLAAKLGLPKHEAEHAVAACNPEKAQTVRAATLEGWLGWSFDHKTKRNGRTRAEHLAEIAERRTAASRRRVTDYLERHPKATISEIARTLAMGRKTVAKYFHEWLEALRDKVVQQAKAMLGASPAAKPSDCTTDCTAVSIESVGPSPTVITSDYPSTATNPDSRPTISTAPSATIDTPVDTSREEGPGRRAFLAYFARMRHSLRHYLPLRASSAPRSAQEEEKGIKKADFWRPASPLEDAHPCSLQPD